MKTKHCVSPDFPEKPWFRGTNTLLSCCFFGSNRKLLHSPPSCLLPFHVWHYQSTSVENTDLVCVMRSCVWCPEGIHTYQRRWQRIISLSVMEDNAAVKTVFFPVIGWKREVFSGKQDTAETHPGRGYVSTRLQISQIFFFSLHLISPSQSEQSHILYDFRSNTQRANGCIWWISVHYFCEELI